MINKFNPWIKKAKLVLDFSQYTWKKKRKEKTTESNVACIYKYARWNLDAVTKVNP